MTEKLPSIVKGWDIDEDTYIKAHETSKLVKLVTETFNGCNLSCEGCFTNRVEGSWTSKGKKRLIDEISFSEQKKLIDEAISLDAKAIDIVGAGEPTLDPLFPNLIEYTLNKGLHAIIFTHGATRQLIKYAEEWKNENVSFFLKLWSRNPKLQNKYVRGSTENYAKQRDEAINHLISLGYTKGETKSLDGIKYETTRLAADILVRKSNYAEIINLFEYCRENNIMPMIKTFIPEGPTKFSQEISKSIYSEEELRKVKNDETTSEEFNRLRKNLIYHDIKKHGIRDLKTLYPQACKCTQSIASIYVTIQGDIKSCVGTPTSYGKYSSGKDMLRTALMKRKEKVSFGCIPRIIETELKEDTMPEELKKIYSKGER